MPQHSMGFDSGLSPIGKQPRFGATSGLAVTRPEPGNGWISKATWSAVRYPITFTNGAPASSNENIRPKIESDFSPEIIRYNYRALGCALSKEDCSSVA
jgi:hypothetical protein